MRALSGHSARRVGAVRNGVYGALDYLAQPLGLLLAAPYLLRHLGVPQFGVWVLACAAVNSGNLISSGFGDAAVKYVAMYRGRSDEAGIARAVRGMLAINFALGSVAAVALWTLAPRIAARVAIGDAGLGVVCAEALRIGGLLLAVRSVDSVFGSTLRAFERYSIAVRISTGFRFAVLAAAVLCAGFGRGVVQIMWVTLAIAVAAAAIQVTAVRAVTGRILLLPALDREMLKRIAGFGLFSWIQAACAVLFGQADRLVVGVALGASAVAEYGLCAQLAQSIHGIVAAGFHVLFPHLSARIESEPLNRAFVTARKALKLNIALAIVLGAPLVLLSRPILLRWVGSDVAAHAWMALSILAGAYMTFAMNVTGHYTLLALGRVRLVTALNLAAGAAMLLLLWPLAHVFGLAGAASARLVTGPITCLMYVPLVRWMRESAAQAKQPVVTAAWEDARCGQ